MEGRGGETPTEHLNKGWEVHECSVLLCDDPGPQRKHDHMSDGSILVKVGHALEKFGVFCSYHTCLLSVLVDENCLLWTSVPLWLSHHLISSAMTTGMLKLPAACGLYLPFLSVCLIFFEVFFKQGPSPTRPPCPFSSVETVLQAGLN